VGLFVAVALGVGAGEVALVGVADGVLVALGVAVGVRRADARARTRCPLSTLRSTSA